MARPEPHPQPLDDASSESLVPRTPGSMRGLIHVTDDFNDPLPDWLLDAFEGIDSSSEE